MAVDPEAESALALFELLGAAVFRTRAPAFELRFASAPPLAFSGERFWEEALEAEDVLKLQSVLAAVSADGRGRTLEHGVKLAGARRGWLRTSVLRTRGGELLGAMLDVSEAHHNERQWRELESWLVTLGEALPFDFWICDRHGRYVLQNPVSILQRGDLSGRNLRDPELSSEPCWSWEDAFDRALRGETVREELVCEGHSPPRYLVRVVSPVHQGGQVQGIVGVHLDVTSLKQTEERLRQSVLELKGAQEALVRRRELAALGEMAAVVAHEIRNPLGAIANACSLLRRSAAVSERDSSLCHIVEDEVSRLDGLVKALLQFTRPLEARLRPGSLGALLEDAIAQSLRAEQAQDRVRVLRELDPTLPPVPMDPQLLSVAFGNVVRNALQAMPQSGELRVTVGREGGPGAGWARVVISDTGPGLPEEVQRRLFQPFVTTRATGTGLGLAIVRRLVSEHRGAVELRSEAGRGTTCVIRVPLADEAS